MDIDKKRTLIFIILVVLAVVGSTVYFIWGNIIDRGTLRITGAAPFQVEVYGLSRHDCAYSPCEIKLRSGGKDLIVSKDGANTIVTNTSVKLWGTTELKLDFDILPVITTAENIPQEESLPAYSLIFDSGTGKQKLIRTDDPGKKALAYFPGSLKKHKIIGGEKTALILDKKDSKGIGYLIDIAENSREKIENKNLADLEEGKWSNSGKYLLFKRSRSSYLWLLNAENQSVMELPLATELESTSWLYNDDLTFITSQSYKTENDFEMILSDQIAINGFTFGIYHPDGNRFERIGNFADVNSLPEKFISTANGSAIYFQLNGENFKIELWKRSL